MANSVFSGFVTACLLAGWPTNLSLSVIPTIDGVVLAPSLFSMIFGALPSITETHELVVPKSIPITLAIKKLLFKYLFTSQISNFISINFIQFFFHDYYFHQSFLKYLPLQVSLTYHVICNLFGRPEQQYLVRRRLSELQTLLDENCNQISHLGDQFV